MYKLTIAIGSLFTCFIIWIIYLANTGDQSIFFTVVAHVPNGDKLGHVLLFGCLTFFAITGLKFRSVSLGKFRIYYGILAVSTFVIVEEFSQMFIPSRTFDFMDLLANMVGILVSSAICVLWRRSSGIRTEP